MLLAAAGNPETTQLLINLGAKSDKVDSKGRSAYDFSIESLAQDEERYRFTKPEYREEFRLPYIRAQNVLAMNKSRQERISLYGRFFVDTPIELNNVCIEKVSEYAGFSVK